MDKVRTAKVSPVDDARFARRQWRRRFLLRLPEISVAAVVVGLIFAGFQLLGGSGVAPSSSGSDTAQSQSAVSSQVYSVSQVLAGLQKDPSAWTGHSILVQGVLQGPLSFCAQATPCPPERLALMDDGNTVLASNHYLPITYDRAQDLSYNVPTTYGLQLQAAPEACALNPAIVCYQGTVLTTASSLSQ